MGPPVSGVRPAVAEPTVPGARAVLLTDGGPAEHGHTAETLAALLDRLEFGLIEDFRAAIRPANDAERIAVEMGWPDLVMRARLVRADILGRLGDIAAS